MWQGDPSADDTRGSMKYAPLPWVHLADALKTSLRRLRIVLEEPAFTSERTFVRLHDGPRSESITETRPLLTIAGNHERGWLRRLELLDRPDQQLDILSLDQPADGDKDDPVSQSKPRPFAFGRNQSP